MPFTNYKILKERMTGINKGFWKVQSIHKLSTKLSNRFNTKDYIIMKTIQKTPNYIPPFITFFNESHQFNISQNKSIKKKSNSKEHKNVFLTNESIKTINESYYKTKRENKKKLFLNLYKNFPYEPYLYNELQFIYLQGNNKLTPRKFKEVVKDCFIMDKYNKFLINKKYNISNFNSNNSKNINNSGSTLQINKSKNYNNNSDSNYFKSLSVEKSINRTKRNINKKCKTENEELEINNNYFNTINDGFYNRKSKKCNCLPSIGNKQLTEGKHFL